MQSLATNCRDLQMINSLSTHETSLQVGYMLSYVSRVGTIESLFLLKGLLLEDVKSLSNDYLTFMKPTKKLKKG